jgi:hypothetical protein
MSTHHACVHDQWWCPCSARAGQFSYQNSPRFFTRRVWQGRSPTDHHARNGRGIMSVQPATSPASTYAFRLLGPSSFVPGGLPPLPLWPKPRALLALPLMSGGPVSVERIAADCCPWDSRTLRSRTAAATFMRCAGGSARMQCGHGRGLTCCACRATAGLGEVPPPGPVRAPRGPGPAAEPTARRPGPLARPAAGRHPARARCGGPPGGLQPRITGALVSCDSVCGT